MSRQDRKPNHHIDGSVRAFALALALLPQAALAQETLSPGHAGLNGSKLQPGRWSMQLIATRDGQELPPVNGEMELSSIVLEGRPALQFVQAIHTPRGVMTDTIVMLAAGLQPIRHRSHGPGRVMELDFAGKVVTGRTAANGATPEPFRRETTEPTFDSGALELILAAAPLAPGYRARAPMYIHEQNGLVWHDITVTGEEAVTLGATQTPAWQVEVRTDAFSVTYLIGKNREPLGIRSTRDNMSFRMVRR